METFALSHIIFKTGDTIIHRNLGYTAKILKLYSRGNALIEIPITPDNIRIWNQIPKPFKALNIAKTFKKQVYAPTIY